MAEIVSAISDQKLLLFSIDRTDTTVQNVYTLPANAIITGIMITGVHSDAGTSATLSVGLPGANQQFLNAADVKTGSLTQSWSSAAILSSVGSSPAQITAIYAETGTPSTTGGPWTIQLYYIVR